MTDAAPDTAAPEKRTINRLDRPKGHKVCSWLQARELVAGDTYVTLAQAASLELGFQISAYSIKDCLLAVEKALPAAPKPMTDLEFVAGVLVDVIGNMFDGTVPVDQRLLSIALRKFESSFTTISTAA